MIWNSDHSISIDPPKNPKKITGTRFASILGLNRWNTEFKTWCEITRTYEEPFEDTIYTIAGKTIEPKQADYIESEYMMEITRPVDVYGENYFSKTRGDFFPQSRIFGGMWDYLGEIDGEKYLLEMKTTKRAEDWLEEPPKYYLLQAALYAYLLGIDNVMMVCNFLTDTDYKDPDAYIPTDKNTYVYEFKLSEKYPKFAEDYIYPAMAWWDYHINNGISPIPEKADEPIVEILKTKSLNPDTEISELLAEAEDLKEKLDLIKTQNAQAEKRYKELNALIKEFAIQNLPEGDTKAVLHGQYTWELSLGSKTSVDTDAMKADGIYEKYAKSEPTYTLRVKETK